MHHCCFQTAVQFCDFVAKHEVLCRSASVGGWYRRQVGCIITSVREQGALLPAEGREGCVQRAAGGAQGPV